ASTVTLSAVGSVAEGGSIVYTASVDAAVTGTPLVITLSNGQTLTIPVGQSSADSAPFLRSADGREGQAGDTLTVAITGTSGGSIEGLTTTSTVTTTVADDSDATTVTLSAAGSVTEGGSIIYTASLDSPVTGSPLVVTLSNGQTITIPVGQSSADSAPFLVRADDAYVQANDTLTVEITGTPGDNSDSLTTTGTVTTTVTDDTDATTVTLSAAGSVAEGGSIVYTASLDAAVTGTPLVITLSNGQTIT